jgi:BlaI family transcriptional regulator, penicillinase repressor
MPIARPSDLELQVLSVLWERGPSTARQVLEFIPDGKQRAYTTVLSVLQVMEKKGLVTHTSQGVKHVYRPAVSKRQTLRPLLRSLVSNIFGGSPSIAMQHLLSETDVSADELAKIREVLDSFDSSKSAVKKRGASR